MTHLLLGVGWVEVLARALIDQETFSLSPYRVATINSSAHRDLYFEGCETSNA